MACKGAVARARAVCVDWERTQRLRCVNWAVDWVRRCIEWYTSWSQRCDAWRTESEQRCDRWEEESTRSCDDWFFLFKWICLAWTWVTTLVCRVWTWVTTTICTLWTWVSTVVCLSWALVGIVVCTLWVMLTTFVCRAWIFVLDATCLISCFFKRLFAPNEYSKARSECIYGWTAAYRIEDVLDECVVNVTLRIRLVGDDDVTAAQLANLRAIAEPAIEAEWSGQHPLVLVDGTCQCKRYVLTVDVQFVDSGEHHVVAVHAGSGREDMANWYVTTDGDTAAHEAGHMFGNADEYVDSACPSRIVTSDGSLMQTTSGNVLERHYQGFADWLSDRTCCDYEPR